MKNIALLSERRNRLDDHSEDFVAGLCEVSINDGQDQATIVLTKGGSLVCVFGVTETVWTAAIDDLCANKGEWFDVNFADPYIVCLSKGGAIVTIDPDTGEANLEGEFENGLETGAWSPDGEILLLVTLTDAEEESEGDNNCVILSMNKQFEVLAEVPIHKFVSSQQGSESLVTACWQPDGSRCAVSTLDENDHTRRIRIYDRETLAVQAVGRSEDGSGKTVPNLHPLVAWASNGCSNLLASIQKKGRKTKQIVFFEPNGLRHREFTLKHPDDAVIGLRWNVESDLLAIALRSQVCDRIQLWHRSNYHWYLKYEWQFDKQKIAWLNFHDERPYKFLVSLEGGINWREYELQWDPSTIRISGTESILSCTAAVIDGSILNVTPLDKALVPPPMYASNVSAAETIREVCFNQRPDSTVTAALYLSSGTFSLVHNQCTNCELKTGFAFSATVTPIEWGNVQGKDEKSLHNCVFVGEDGPLLYLAAVACQGDNENCCIVKIKIDRNEKWAVVEESFSVDDNVYRMVSWSDCADGALIESEDGSLFEFNLLDGVTPIEVEPLLEPCPWIAGVRNIETLNQGSNEHTQSRLAFGRSSKGRLYCHDRLLSNAVSSFILSPSHGFLCYTSAGAHCRLISLPLVELYNFDPLMGSEQNDAADGYEPRNVERGSRLVAVLPLQPTVILQMPRGNLEATYPRALVLPHAMSQIYRKEYGRAFLMMRRLKVDMNLIIDLDPESFVQGGGALALVEQVTSIDHLNLFISCLQDFDITKTRYPVPSWSGLTRNGNNLVPDESVPPWDPATKVNRVCQTVRAAMEEAERSGQTGGGRTIPDGHFLLPILSTFAKERPPKLQEALGMIRERALTNHPKASKKPPLFSDKTQSSIQYLAFLADYDILYKTSLGMYDYDLARAVARNSQMDPKAYLPLLKRLKSMPGFYAKFEVDMLLGRFESALTNLYHSGAHKEDLSEIEPENQEAGNPPSNSFEKCLSLVETHKLHRTALKLYGEEAEKKGLVLKSLGDRLLSEGQCNAALSVFLSMVPPDLDRAKQAARKGGAWRSYFSFLSGFQDETEKAVSRKVAYEFAEEIAAQGNARANRGNYANAARILLDYCDDAPGAIDMLVAAEMWDEASRVAALHGHDELVKKCTDAVIDFAQNAINDLEERATAFTESNKRFAKVVKLRKKVIKDLGVTESKADDTLESGSTFSMASNASLRSDLSSSSVGSALSSVISVGTTSTFTMSSEHDINRHKSKYNTIGRKKKVKKKKSSNKKMKAGSEDELRSLVSALKSACVDAAHCEILSEAMFHLTKVGNFSLARDLYEAYIRLDSAIKNSQLERRNSAESSREPEEFTKAEAAASLTLSWETEVNALQCPPLPSELRELFSFI